MFLSVCPGKNGREFQGAKIIELNTINNIGPLCPEKLYGHHLSCLEHIEIKIQLINT